MNDTGMFVIWAYDKQSWWRADHCGYTKDIAEAGLYSSEDASRIVVRSFPDQFMVPESYAKALGSPPFHPYGRNYSKGGW